MCGQTSSEGRYEHVVQATGTTCTSVPTGPLAVSRRNCLKAEHLLMIPGLLIIVILTIYPIAYLVKTAFFKQGFDGLEFYALKNIAHMLSDPFFWTALRNTFEYVLLAVTFEIILGLALALFLANVKSPFIRLVRAIVLLPSMTPNVVVGIIWLILYYPFGLINYVSQALGLGQHMFLADPKLAMYSVIAVDIWQWTPMVFLILIAGVSNLPESPLEAAKIDGASGWQTLRYVTLPLLRPTISVALLFRTMDAFRAFDKLVSLTFGGPADRTMILSIHLYKVAFRHLRWEYGALIALTLILLSLTVSRTYIRGALGRGR